MIDTLRIFEELKETFGPSAAKKLAEILGMIYEELKNAVTKVEFQELRMVVSELAEAQRNAEARLTRLEQTVHELTEAQRNAEARLTRLEQTVHELAEAQKKTEQSLNRLIKRVDHLEERVEGISNSIGYTLENLSYKRLPLLLKKEGINIKEKLIRRYYEENQINIWGRARRADKEILILGEVKVRPSRKEINRFIKICDRIKKKESKDAFLVFVAHDYHPSVERYLREKGIRYYWSYELEA